LGMMLGQIASILIKPVQHTGYIPSKIVFDAIIIEIYVYL